MVEMLTVQVKQEVLKKRKFKPRARRFKDQNWKEVLDFIRQYSCGEETFLMPDEFCDVLANSLYSSHIYSYDEIDEEKRFDWVIIHKGRLELLQVDFLNKVYLSKTPVFANDVFVIFADSKEVPIFYYKSDHLRALKIAISKLRLKSFLNQVKNSLSFLRKRMLFVQKDRTRFELKNRTQFEKKAETKSLQSLAQSLQKQTGFGAQVSTVPLAWVATSRHQPFVNLGDALSPIMASALSGLPVTHQDFKSWKTRLACAGTIAHGFIGGTVHLWGTGIDHQKHPTNPKLKCYKKPPGTRFYIHALRGPFSAQTFRQQGIDTPDIYGDPIWFLPSIIDPVEKQYELGVIVHLSELEGLSDISPVKQALLRYKIPESLASQIKIITTMTQPTFAALEAKTKEITACKRIVSTSLHGLVIAEAYGIPCVYFRTLGKGVTFPNLDDDSERLDWRMRDFYKGVGLKNLFVYGQRRPKETDWESVIQAVDQYWQPLCWSPDAFLESFPLPLAFNPLREKYKGDRSLLSQIKL